MTNTRFVDSSGLSPSNLSTASDLAKMTRAAAAYEVIREYSTTEAVNVTLPDSKRKLSFVNTNALVRASDYLQAQRLRRRLTVEMQATFEDWDVLLSPGMLLPAPPLAVKQIWPSLNLPMIDMPYSLTGNPSLVICGGFFPDGTPIGVQLAGRYFDEATILKVAHAYERASPWRDRRPDLDRWFADGRPAASAAAS